MLYCYKILQQPLPFTKRFHTLRCECFSTTHKNAVLSSTATPAAGFPFVLVLIDRNPPMLCSQENRKLFRADPSLDSWKIYVEFIDDIVVEGFFQAILHDLDFFLMNTERQLKPAPFFQAQMLLMPPEIVFKPPLEREAGDGIYDLVEEMLCSSFRMSAQMERVAAHLDVANYQVFSQKLNWDNEKPQKDVSKSHNTGFCFLLLL